MGTLLAVFAHPDDETFMCGGALAKYAAQGHAVYLACATLGEMGRRMGGPPLMVTRESMGELRRVELTKACDALGISRVELLGYRDKTLEFESVSDVTRSIQTLFEAVRPDVVVTFHERYGGHPDHCAIGKATTVAFENYTRESSPNSRLYFAAWANMVNQFNKDQIVRVNVKQQLPAKLGAYRAHRTQSTIMKWLWQRDAQAVRKLATEEYFIANKSQTENELFFNDDTDTSI